MASEFFIGLDLGQAVDPTALAVLERPPVEVLDSRPGVHTTNGVVHIGKKPRPKPEDAVYYLRTLKRFQLGTPYTEIVERVSEYVIKPPLKDCTLILDETGVGRPVVDLFRQKNPSARLIPLTITAGSMAGWGENGSIHVPKVQLVSNLQVLLQTRKRLRIAQGISEGAMLVKEIDNFQVKVTTSANEVYGAFREGEHDDLVFAVGMAAWWAEKMSPTGAGVIEAVEPESAPTNILEQMGWRPARDRGRYWGTHRR
jgi:hypothetical protein